MQYKLRKTLILSSLVLSGVLVVGVTAWGIVHNYKVEQRNKPYNKFYFQNINGKDVYISVRDAGDTSAVLFANKYVKITRDAFISEVNNKLYLNERLLINSLNIDYRSNPYDQNDFTFYPSERIEGQSKITARYPNANNDGFDPVVELTYFEQAANGEDLFRSGYYPQRPTNINDTPSTDEMNYRVTENGKNIYYMYRRNANTYRNSTLYLHAKEYASRIINPTSYSTPIYYRYLDDFDFTLQEQNLISPTIGLKDNNVELVENLPEGILDLNKHVVLPSSYANETFFIRILNSFENVMYRYIIDHKDAS